MRNLIMLIFIVCSGLFAGDVSDVKSLISKHWKTQNEKKWQEFVSTLHSGGTMNGDSNGSFWYRQDATVKAVTKNQVASNRFDFTPRYRSRHFRGGEICSCLLLPGWHIHYKWHNKE